MKKTDRILLCLILCAAVLLPLSGTVGAVSYSSEPYYYEDYYVEIFARPDRTYEVTEEITVCFNEESHGIFRDIPLEGSAEGYTISNITVDGAPHAVTDYGSYIEVRIGDPDLLVTGSKTYVLRYDLEHYADYVTDKDYFYVNVLGYELDAPVARFHADLYLPQDGELLDSNLISGASGASGNDCGIQMNYDADQRVVRLESNGGLPAYTGVTYWAEFTEGAFSDAIAYAPPYTINSFDADIAVDQYSSLVITERVSFTPNDPVEGFYFFAPVFDESFSLENLTVEVPEGVRYSQSGDRVWINYSSAMNHQKIDVVMRFEYSRIVAQDGADDFVNLQFFETSHEFFVDQYSIRYTAAVGAPKSVSFVIGRYNDYADQTHRYDLTKTGGDIHVAGKDRLSTREQMRMDVFYPNGTFARRMTLLDYLGPGAGILSCLSALLLAIFKKQRPLSPPIEYYPPDGLNPAEVGFVIDRNVDGRDITSLIYFWASHGHLKIEMTGKKNFVLHRLTDLDAKHPAYEIEMYQYLWNINLGVLNTVVGVLTGNQPLQTAGYNTVTRAQLTNRFYVAIQRAVSGVKKSFSNTRSLAKKSADFLSGIITAVGILLIAIIGIASQQFVSTVFSVIFSFLASRLVRSAVTNKHKKSPVPLCIFAGILGVISAVVLLIGLVLSGRFAMISGAVFVLTAVGGILIAPFITRLSDYGIDITERCVGFKMFLETAERHQLEAMLEQTPDYYYNILPYAQVLGVTKIWSQKFDGLLNYPPSWYYGAGVDPAMPLHTMMIQQMNSMGNTMTSRPASSGGSGGGFSSGSFSGGGGGFSGGGSGGGGSGGGGGGRW